MTLLQVRDLNVKLGRRYILRNISLDVGDGLTMLVGRNGCGKSTLMRAILGLIPSKGDILFDGTDIRRLSTRSRARLLAYLPQRQTIPSGTSVSDYVSMGASAASGLLISPDIKDVDAARSELAKLGLDGISHRHMETLSGGEARLCALARARMQKSRMLIMDEPLAGLDYARQHEFMKQTRLEGKPVFMSIHDPMLAWQYADNILVMSNGAILRCDRNDEAGSQQILTQLYGASLRFEQVGDMRLPIWHND